MGLGNLINGGFFLTIANKTYQHMGMRNFISLNMFSFCKGYIKYKELDLNVAF